MDPERQPYKVVKSAEMTAQLAAEGGATLVTAALRRALGARPIQEAVRLFQQLMGLRDMTVCENGLLVLRPSSRRRERRSIRLTQRSTRRLSYILLIQGILLLECRNLSPAENAAVLATSGATLKEGGSIGNSYLYVDLAASFIAQWDDEALTRRDKNPQIRTDHTAAAATGTVDGGEWEDCTRGPR